MRRLLTIRQAVEESGIPYDALLRVLHEEQLLVKLPGRRSYFVDPADLEALIERSKGRPSVFSTDDPSFDQNAENKRDIGTGASTGSGTKLGTKSGPKRGKTHQNRAPQKWDKGWHEKYLH